MNFGDVWRVLLIYVIMLVVGVAVVISLITAFVEAFRIRIVKG